MSKLNTIDERIRKGAREKLSQEIQVAANNLMNVIEIQGTADIVSIRAFGEADSDTTDMFAYNRDLIVAIAKQATDKLSIKYEEIAISKFIAKVDYVDDNELFKVEVS